MNTTLQKIIEYYESRCQYVDAIGEMWRGMDFTKYALYTIRRIADNNERLETYDQLVQYIENKYFERKNNIDS